LRLHTEAIRDPALYQTQQQKPSMWHGGSVSRSNFSRVDLIVFVAGIRIRSHRKLFYHQKYKRNFVAVKQAPPANDRMPFVSTASALRNRRRSVLTVMDVNVQSFLLRGVEYGMRSVSMNGMNNADGIYINSQA
jgi:hypothetical protein